VAPGAAYAPVRPVAPKPASKTSILDKVMQGPSFTVAGVKVPVFAAAAAAVALLLVILLAVLIFGGNSPEDIAETTVERYFGEADADDILDLYPEEYVEYLLDEYEIDEDDLIAAIEDYIEETVDDCEDEEIELYDVEIRSVKDKKKKNYENLVEFYEDELDLEVEDIKVVKCKAYYEYEGDDETETYEITVICIDGDYYTADMYWLSNIASDA
jgi:hypothetical protein